MSFGSRLRERREAVGLKQKELGELLGVSGNAVGNYEKGISSPNADALYKVFDVLKCDANYLFQDEMNSEEIKSPLPGRAGELLEYFDGLNPIGQQKVIDYAKDLYDGGIYSKNSADKLA